jgi:hypothetical protein
MQELLQKHVMRRKSGIGTMRRVGSCWYSVTAVTSPELPELKPELQRVGSNVALPSSSSALGLLCPDQLVLSAICEAADVFCTTCAGHSGIQ